MGLHGFALIFMDKCPSVQVSNLRNRRRRTRRRRLRRRTGRIGMGRRRRRRKGKKKVEWEEGGGEEEGEGEGEWGGESQPTAWMSEPRSLGGGGPPPPNSLFGGFGGFGGFGICLGASTHLEADASADVRCMIVGCSLDVRWTFNRCSLGFQTGG